jgi:hypothetical protein
MNRPPLLWLCAGGPFGYCLGYLYAWCNDEQGGRRVRRAARNRARRLLLLAPVGVS